MAYVKNTWVDQNVERPKTYEVTNNQDGSITLTDSFGLVTELGTPVNATNMNHIEDGLADTDVTKYNATTVYSAGEWVTGTVNNEKGIYSSLVNNNVGNALTDTTKWKKVDFPDKDYIDQSKALETGSVSTNAGVYTWIKSMIDNSFGKSKFTIVGSPTVTNNGIASSFSSSNYLTTPTIDLSSANSWRIESPLVKFEPTSSNRYALFWVSGTPDSGINILQLSDRIVYGIYNVDGAGGTLLDRNYDLPTDLTKWYQFAYEFTGTQYKIYYREKGGEWVNTGSVNSSTKLPAITSPIYIGNNNSGNAPFNGQMDIKPLKFIANNVEIFTSKDTRSDTVTIGGSSVTIPYIVSQTGSKIADVAYRTNIQNLYAQEGLADYFTIDEINQDFTLPMGEVYGMIQRKADLNKINSYDEPDLTSGVSKTYDTLYTADEDGWLYCWTSVHVHSWTDYHSHVCVKTKVWNNSETNYTTIHINNCNFVNNNSSGAGPFNEVTSFCRIYKGQKYKMYTDIANGDYGIDGTELIFYPVKGV